MHISCVLRLYLTFLIPLVRRGVQRSVLSFRPAVAPFKAAVLPLDSVVNRDPRNPTYSLQSSLTGAGLSAIVDDSGASIGKRYSRSDEVGVACCSA
jgi:glycyl-tRNA synthetase